MPTSHGVSAESRRLFGTTSALNSIEAVKASGAFSLVLSLPTARAFFTAVYGKLEPHRNPVKKLPACRIASDEQNQKKA